MLITLQSNSNADASDFVNYFKETVMIEPKSELSLVNISYKFENGITVRAGVNDTFDVSIGRDNDYTTCTITAGEYATDADFATACFNALAVGIGTMDYWQQKAFKSSSQTFTVEGASTDRLKLTLQYDPENWGEQKVAGALITTAVRQQVYGNPAGVIPDFNQGLLKRTTGGVFPGAYNVDTWRSGYGDAVNQTNVMWATARDADQKVPHGKIKWKGYRTGTVEWVVGMAEGAMPNTAGEWAVGSTALTIAVRCVGGIIKIEERNNAGQLAVIMDNVAINDGESIEIQLDQMIDTTTDTFAKYYIGGVEQVIPGGADRFVLKPGLDLMPVGSFLTPNIVSSLISGGATYLLPSCVDTFTFTAGSGYFNGEIVEFEGGSGSKTTGLITTNAAGEIQTLSLQERGGNFAAPGDTGLVITGLMSGSATATIDITAVDNSIVFSNAGFTYKDLPSGNAYTQGANLEDFDTTDLGDVATYRRTQQGTALVQWWEAVAGNNWNLYNSKPNAGDPVSNTATLDPASGVITVGAVPFTPTGGVQPDVAYSLANADVIHNGITYANAVEILTVSGAGAIEDFRWNNLLPNDGVVAGDTIIISQGGNQTCKLIVGAVNAETNMIYDVITDTVKRQVAGGVDEPLGLHNRASFRPSAGFKTTTGMNAVGPGPATPLTTIGTTQINDGREDTTFLVNVEEFMLKSICKEGGIQKAIASIPYGLTQPEFENGDPVKVDGEFYYEPYNTLYHDLSNPSIENHNQLRVRLTDSVGNPIQQMKHPTTLTLDLRPRAK